MADTRRQPIIEAKVKTSTIAAMVTGLILSALTALPGDINSGVQEAVLIIVFTIVPGLTTFIAGWLTKHTPRELFNLEVVNDLPKPEIPDAN